MNKKRVIVITEEELMRKVTAIQEIGKDLTWEFVEVPDFDEMPPEAFGLVLGNYQFCQWVMAACRAYASDNSLPLNKGN